MRKRKEKKCNETFLHCLIAERVVSLGRKVVNECLTVKSIVKKREDDDCEDVDGETPSQTSSGRGKNIRYRPILVTGDCEV